MPKGRSLKPQKNKPINTIGGSTRSVGDLIPLSSKIRNLRQRSKICVFVWLGKGHVPFIGGKR